MELGLGLGEEVNVEPEVVVVGGRGEECGLVARRGLVMVLGEVVTAVAEAELGLGLGLAPELVGTEVATVAMPGRDEAEP